MPYAKTCAGGLSRARELLDGIERARRVDGKAFRLDVADSAAAVDDERDPFGESPRVVPDAVLSREAAVDVAQQTERQVQLARPGQGAPRRIDGDADDFRVGGRVAALVIPEPGEFEVSAAGERLDVEGEHDEVAPLERVGEPERPAVLVAEGHVGGPVADRHRRPALGRRRRRRQDQQQREGETAAAQLL